MPTSVSAATIWRWWKPPHRATVMMDCSYTCSGLLCFLCANYNILVAVRHIPGVDNTQADTLSRNMITKIFSPLQGGSNAHTCARRPPRPGNGDAARLDLCQLESEAARLLQRGLAKSTTKPYNTVRTILVDFCIRLQLTPLPASEETLALFVAELAQTRAHSTIMSYLSAVRHLRVIHGLGNPLKDTLRLDLILRVVQRTKPKGTRMRLPVTPRILRSIKSSYDPSPRFDSTMLWAACCTFFWLYAMCRVHDRIDLII